MAEPSEPCAILAPEPHTAVIIFGLFEVLMRQLLFAAVLFASVSACGGAPPPGLAPGAPAPAFTLPGVDGRTHSLQDYSDRRVLAVVFTSNTCPASQLYEARIQRLHEDYRRKGVAVVAVNSNRPAAIQLADLAHTDVGESLEDIKVRAEHRKLAYPYLSDGETQTVTKQFGVAPCRTSSCSIRRAPCAIRGASTTARARIS